MAFRSGLSIPVVAVDPNGIPTRSGLAIPVSVIGADGAPLNTWRVVAASGVAASHTGSLVETTLATVTVPAGAMGPNGAVRIYSQWSYTNSANNKTASVKWGGSNIHTVNYTTTAAVRLLNVLSNRGAENSQVVTGNNAPITTPAAFVPQTFAVNTAQAVAISFTGTLALATETITLEQYTVEVLYMP